MHTDAKRRLLLRGSVLAGAAGVGVGTGLLTAQSVVAAWPKAAFEAKQVGAAVEGAMGSAGTEASEQIEIKAPDIAENGAVVPVTVTTALAVESIAIVAENNPSPLAAVFELGPGAQGYVSTRIKMGKTGDVVAVVKTGGQLYAARKGVKVTIGGCGG